VTSRPLAHRSPAPLAVLLVALACNGELRSASPEPPDEPAAVAEAPAPADDPEAPAGTPSEPPAPVVTRTLTKDGDVIEAEFGKADQLPRDFPDDVPVYANARPLSSMQSPTHGMVVNLRSPDTPAQVFAWYQENYAAQGWEVEQAREEHARSILVVRKGNRISSVVVMGVPGATQALVSVEEDR
jgi:hypothetical protein